MLHEIPAAQQIGIPLLSLLVAWPLFWALSLLLVGRAAVRRVLALVGAGVELLLAAALTASFDPRTADLQFVERRRWIPSIGAEYHLGVDGISVLFVPLTAFLFLMILIASWNSMQSMSRAHLFSLFALEAITLGIFCSLDLVLFFVFWELMLIPTYFLVSLWGVGPERRYAALKFVITMMIGSSPLLVGIILLGLNHHQVTGAAGLPAAYSFDYLTLLRTPIPARLQGIVFILMFIGFAVKSPLIPFHTWLPTVVMEGPFSAAVLLTGVKLGSYGMLRFVVPLSPEASARWIVPMSIVGAAGIVYGALIALVQPNLRRMLAFASISHIGFVMLGIASLNRQGMQGALLQMINIGFISTGLMFLVGFLHARTGTSESPSLGGVAQRAPLLAGFFLLLGAASIGLPGTSGFNGEHLILLGAFRSSRAAGVAALLGVVLGAAALLSSFERAFLGPALRPVVMRLSDLRPRERLLVAVMSLSVLGLGFFPAPLLDITSASIDAVVQRVHPTPPATLAGVR